MQKGRLLLSRKIECCIINIKKFAILSVRSSRWIKSLRQSLQSPLGGTAIFPLTCARLLLRRVVLAVLYSLLISTVALAQGGEAVPAHAEQLPPRIELDEEAGVIRFIIDGAEAARLDAAGLHIRGNLEYGGTLKDSGPAGYDVSSAGKDGEEPR